MINLVSKIQKIKLAPKVYRDLPEDPGVYLYFRNGEVIYVGKAINLRRRVASYFRLNLETKTKKMISEALEIAYIKVGNEFEALLLEAKLIKKYLPKYNIVAKDDKHPLYVLITKETFPRVLAVRKADLKTIPSTCFYGPFPSSGKVKAVLKMIRRAFPYSDHKIGKRACLYSQIGLCNPCPNEIVHSTEYLVLRKIYLQNIRHIKALLDGKIDKVKLDLEKEMDFFSRKQLYEEAGEVKNKIKALEYVASSKFPIDLYLENPNLADEIKSKEMQELLQIIQSEDLPIVPESLRQIECYDVAHLQGTNATASMVTFVDALPDKNKYRHFKIRQNKTMSDTDSLKEVISRRLNHVKDWGRPNLIIVDGGVGQVKAFASVLETKKVDIPVVGIAKHPDRLIIGSKKIKLSGRPLNLVSRMRDEAHRFARVYHHKLYSRSLFES